MTRNAPGSFEEPCATADNAALARPFSVLAMPQGGPGSAPPSKLPTMMTNAAFLAAAHVALAAGLPRHGLGGPLAETILTYFRQELVLGVTGAGAGTAATARRPAELLEALADAIPLSASEDQGVAFLSRIIVSAIVDLTAAVASGGGSGGNATLLDIKGPGLAGIAQIVTFATDLVLQRSLLFGDRALLDFTIDVLRRVASGAAAGGSKVLRQASRPDSALGTLYRSFNRQLIAMLSQPHVQDEDVVYVLHALALGEDALIGGANMGMAA
jgi:hypothetical protein